MKTLSLFLAGFMLSMCLCYAEDTTDTEAETTSALESVTAALETDFMISFKNNLDDATLFDDFFASYEAYVTDLQEKGELDITNLDEVASQFTLTYVLEHPEWAEESSGKVKDALAKTAVEMYLKDPDNANLLKIVTALQKKQDALDEETRDAIIEELKKQIDELKNLNQDEKDKAKDALDKIMDQNEKLLNALANTQAQYSNAISQIAANADKLKPATMDPMQMIMMLMMLMMMMKQMKS